MPISGFHVEDEVRTPAGLVAYVTKVERRSGVEMVTVRYEGGDLEREYRAAALRLIEKPLDDYPNGHFCHRLPECRGRSSCPREIACTH